MPLQLHLSSCVPTVTELCLDEGKAVWVRHIPAANYTTLHTLTTKTKQIQVVKVGYTIPRQQGNIDMQNGKVMTECDVKVQ